MNPPARLDGARVLLYTPEGLAICRYDNDPGVYLMHCDEEWRTLKALRHDTVDSARRAGKGWVECGDVRVIALQGEFDGLNVPDVRELVDALVELGCTRFVFNVAEVTFVNSIALGYLIETQRRVRRLGGDVVLSQPSDFFRRTLKTLGLHELFATFDDDDAAADALKI